MLTFDQPSRIDMPSVHVGISSIHQQHPLATLSMAAEQAASLHMSYNASSTRGHDIPHSFAGFNQASSLSAMADPTPQPHSLTLPPMFEDPFDDLSSLLENGSLSTYHFSSLVSAEQPMPFFSPESISRAPEIDQAADGGFDPCNDQADDDARSFSRFGSRLPSLQPEDPVSSPSQSQPGNRPLNAISPDDYKVVLTSLNEFHSVLPPGLQFPSRLALARYLAGFINGFHQHLPFLHIQTMTVYNCNIELILAMAAVGSQYCFEGEKAVEIFHLCRAIAMERVKRKGGSLNVAHARSPQETRYDYTSQHPNDHMQRHSWPALSNPTSDFPTRSHLVSGHEDLIQTAQALLILMGLATWAKEKEILREALSLQSILATLIRDHGLSLQPIPANDSWEEWIRIETTKRTKLIVYCFFNLHCIVYNIPSLLLNAEINLALPSSSAEFKATTRNEWFESKKQAPPELNFQEALYRLFSEDGNDVVATNSALGNYILIHAIIQDIFFLRQLSRGRADRTREIAPNDVAALELALRNWQTGWKRNPESSLDPQDPNGPVAFNSTALLRLAYIRLTIDIGPGRALDTRDPLRIAIAIRESPPIKRTPKLVRAVLHSAHALSIPVKIGIRLVARTQVFVWSIQHSLCSLECAVVLSKWLEALSVPNPDPPISDDERRIGALVKVMLDETEFPIRCHLPLESPAVVQQMNAGVLRVWAQVFRGTQTWAIVDVIGNALDIYADMLVSR
ncbi:hypothetical protein FQN57_006012 [Myotisia sp. PD_48]|nr:hypothetical protein FQN57_006012 [Myotisia sp. PD_48]